MSTVETDRTQIAGIADGSYIDQGLTQQSNDLVLIEAEPVIILSQEPSTHDITPTGRSILLLHARGHSYEVIGQRFSPALSRATVSDRVYQIEKGLQKYGVCGLIQKALEEGAITPAQLLEEYDMSTWDQGENLSEHQLNLLRLLAQDASKAGIARELRVSDAKARADTTQLLTALHAGNELQAGVISLLADAADINLRNRTPDDRGKIEALVQNGLTPEALERLKVTAQKPLIITARKELSSNTSVKGEEDHADDNATGDVIYTDRPLLQQNERQVTTVDLALLDLLIGIKKGLISCELDDDDHPKAATAKLLLVTDGMTTMNKLLEHHLQFIKDKFADSGQRSNNACASCQETLSGKQRENVKVRFILVNKSDEEMEFKPGEQEVLKALCQRYPGNVSLQAAAEYYLTDPSQRK